MNTDLNLVYSNPKEIVAELEKKIQELFQSDDYLKFLHKMSLLHNYSFNNVILILMQMPEATMVASYSTFNKMHRYVKKGSKAIKILCPCIGKKKKDDTDDSDDVQKNESSNNYLYFKFGNVFDVSQTEAIDESGEFKSFVTMLHYDSTFIQSIIDALKDAHSIKISYDSSLNGSTNGYYKIVEKEIYLKEGLSRLHELKTLIHELAHHYQLEYYESLVAGFNRNDLEVSAESIAYVTLTMLSNFYGLPEFDSSSYSVGYIAGWSKDKSLSELKNTLSLISNISNSLFLIISNAIPNIEKM